MRNCIKRIFSYSVLALIAAVLLLPLSGEAYARSPKAGQYSIFGETVEADPGEDPHLKIDQGLVRDFDAGASLTTVEGVDTAIMEGHQATGCKAGVGRSHLKTKLLISLQILFGPLFR